MMKFDDKQLAYGTYVMHDGKQIHLQTWERMSVVAIKGTMKIVADNEILCDTDFCYDIYCGEFGKRFAEMKIKRTANMHLIEHPLLDVPWEQRVTFARTSDSGKSFILEKELDEKNYVRIDYKYYRL